MKSVPASKYDADYYARRYTTADEGMFSTIPVFDHIYEKAASLIKINQEDRIVDLGCGTGQMSIFLNHKFGCDVTGIDYSEAAIDLCRKNAKKFEESGKKLSSEKIKFLHISNQDLPDFSEIKAVFLIDFLEHLYPEEISAILQKIKKWNDKRIFLVIHTDNGLYQKFIRPIGIFLTVHLGGASKESLAKSKTYEFERHVNLMSAGKLQKILQKNGFQIVKLKYPEINIEMIRRQFFALGKYKILLYLTLLTGKIFYFLLPSFYLLAKYEKNEGTHD
jgi:cyclopropane fatty-acyl-phospholipid synthase-like methyltransferase